MADELEVDILGGDDSSLYKGYFTEDVAEDTETKVEDTTQEAIVESTKVEEVTSTPPANWLEEFNKSFQTNYSSVDELKTKFGTTVPSEEIEAIKAQNETLKAREQKLIEIAKGLQDPKSFFPEEVDYKKSLLVKANPSVNKEVAGKVFTVDVENANPLDLIVLDMQLNHKRLVGGEAGARETLLAELGIEADYQWDDLTVAQKNQINIRAEKAAEHISTLRNSVQLPEPMKDIESILQEMQPVKPTEYDITKWDGKIDSVISKVDFIEIKDGDSLIYKEPIDDEYRSGLRDAIVEVIKAKGIDPTPENINGLVEEAKDFYYKENMSQMFKRFKNQIIADYEKEVHAKLHNDTDPDKAQPPVRPASTKATDMYKLLGIDRPRTK